MHDYYLSVICDKNQNFSDSSANIRNIIISQNYTDFLLFNIKALFFCYLLTQIIMLIRFNIHKNYNKNYKILSNFGIFIESEKELGDLDDIIQFILMCIVLTS
eukprot:GHVR01177058.1.p1 GENE.GHVR01177058.1~~GHVR01177058.1.p1  ORF type:complete len:103 (-),score=5.59 GHVR01177058.1:399-707(-)